MGAQLELVAWLKSHSVTLFMAAAVVWAPKQVLKQSGTLPRQLPPQPS